MTRTSHSATARGSILFHAAAGPRLGFGHLVRVKSLATACGLRRPRLALEGGAAARAAATALGCRLEDGGPSTVLAAVRPDVLVVDDPSARRVRAWCGVAARQGIVVASLHDLGIASCRSDVYVDGGVRPGRPPAGVGQALLGTRYAVLNDGSLARSRARLVRAGRSRTRRPRVLIALGGGPRRGFAGRLAEALLDACPGAEVRVASGLVDGVPADRPGVTWLGPQPSLARELTGCDVAVLAGGLTLYEACALGTPAVAVAVVAAQVPAIRGFAARGAVVDGGSLAGWRRQGELRDATVRTARRVAALVADAPARRRLSRTAARLVDGRGAERVAQVLQAAAAWRGQAREAR